MTVTHSASAKTSAIVSRTFTTIIRTSKLVLVDQVGKVINILQRQIPRFLS